MTLAKTGVTKIFFATDIHGSEVCFKKVVKAASFYGVDVVILGGDLTGKMIIPITRSERGSYELYFQGKNLTLQSDEEVKKCQSELRKIGFYTHILSPEEVTALSKGDEQIANLFRVLMIERLEQWLAFAEQETKNSVCEFYFMPGNDDSYFIDEVITASKSFLNVDRRVVTIHGGYEMLSIGYSNYTPWHTPREKSEKEIKNDISALIPHISGMGKCIFNIHVPPYNTGLDEAPALDEQLRVIYGPGGVSTRPVGSTSVYDAIESCQPLLGLFGHIHESRACRRIKKTLCVNPGSVYYHGKLRGCIVALSHDKISDWQLVEG